MTKLEFINSAALMTILTPAWFWSVDTLELGVEAPGFSLGLLVFGVCTVALSGLGVYHLNNITRNNVPF